MGIDSDLFRSPFQTVSVEIRKAGTPAEDQEAEESDVAMTKILGEPFRFLEIVERIKPVHELTESVLKASAPFGGRFLRQLREDAVELPILELDHAKHAFLFVSQDDVRREVAHEREL